MIPHFRIFRLAKNILEEKKISKDTLKKFAESIPDVQLSVKFDKNKNSFYIGPKYTKFKKSASSKKKKNG